MYGEWWDPLPMLTSSAHPKEAGVFEDLVAVFAEAMAADN
jgi:hypothetical protein